jgi:drug/metabolite transporter (DMT)-like permease
MTDQTRGMILGFVGVAIFALTLPFTRIAVAELHPLFVSLGRTVVAAGVAAVILTATRQRMPSRKQMGQLAVVAAGVVFGFPSLSAYAMQTVPAAHGGVVLGALPLATAVMSTIFAKERPSLAFWFWSIAGSIAVITFALRDGGFALHIGDVYLFGALIAAAMGYAAGGSLSRELGGWQVICWSLVIALPLTIPGTFLFWPSDIDTVSNATWLSFAYLALMSQFIGFFFWNRGLAIGGVARVGQVQLLQTFITLGAAAVINRESIGFLTIAFAILVGLCVWFGRRAKIS